LPLEESNLKAANETRQLRKHVMAGFIPAIHALMKLRQKTWMAGSSPAMTKTTYASDYFGPASPPVSNCDLLLGIISLTFFRP
jgi:hypothetical protein